MPRSQPPRTAPRRAASVGVPLAAALATAFGAGCTIYDCPTVYEPRAVVIDEAPPPVWERVAEAPDKPRGDAVWVEGYWDWQGRWVWVEGHWETGRAGQAWTEPRVVRVQGGYEYHPGYWRQREVAPSPTYRGEGDVRVTARFEARGRVSTGSGGERGTTRTQDGDNRAVRDARGQTASGSGSTGQMREAGGGGDRPRSSATTSDRVRSEGQMGSYETSTTVRGGGSSGGQTATAGGERPTQGATATRPATTTRPPSQSTTTTGAGSQGATATRPPSQSTTTTGTPSQPATTTRPGGPSTTVAGGGDAPATTGGEGPAVVDTEVRGVAAGPLTCRVEAFTVIGGGYMNVAFETRPRGTPEIVVGSRSTVIVAQQNGYQRVRITVPRISGTYNVIAVDEQGRRGDCGDLRVILR